MHGPEWSLVQYEAPGGRPQVAVLVDGRVVEPPAPLTGLSMLEVLTGWDEIADQLRIWSPRGSATLTDARLVAPVTYPPKVICAGANFYGHIKEMGIARPVGPVTPYFFFKPPTTSVIGPGDPIPLPAGGQVDWEAELGIVISRRGRDLTPEEVPAHLAGYVVANDISAREVLKRDNPVSAAFAYDWVSSKAQDGFCPIGPELTPAWQIPDVQNLRLELSVNGVIKQRSSTQDMITTAFDLVVEASKYMTLEPGDIVLTGTAAGVGMPRGEFLSDGDEVVVEIERVGRLTNPVVDARRQIRPANALETRRT